MKGKQRLEFMYNQGIWYGAIGYYKTVDEGFDAFKTFKPYKPIDIGKGEGYDFTAFKLGFDKSQKARIRVMKMKATAQAEIKKVLIDLENSARALTNS